MIKYAQLINEETGLCSVGTGTNTEFYKSIGMVELDVQRSDIDNAWYLTEKCPMKSDEEKANARKQTFYTQFIQTSLGNYRLQPKGYANAQQAMDVTNTMATALGGLTEQLTSLVIFYETPDFTKEEECTEEWLVAHQIKPNVMTLVEWQKFYLEFCQLYAMQQYKTTVNGGNNENTTDTEQSTDVSNEVETKATDKPNVN